MQQRLITFTRILHTGVVNFIRNITLAVAAMAVMVVTLTIVLFSLITNATFEYTIQKITDKIDVSVFLLDTTTEAQGKQLVADIKKHPNVASAEYLNKADAQAKFIKDNQEENPSVATAAALSNNPIWATIHVTPKNLNQIPEITAYLSQPERKHLQIPNSPSYNGKRKEAIDNITHATNVLRKIGIVTVVIFTVVCALIIFNTIQMAIFNRRDEINIMRLLGANTSYIRGPFIVESAIYGFLSAMASIFIVYSAFQASESALQASSLGLLDINYASQYFAQHFIPFLALQIAIGIIIGTVSSIIATRRYLKFKVK